MDLRKKKILFIYLNPTSFVLDDITYLSDKFEVLTFFFNSIAGNNPLLILLKWIREKIWLLKNIRSADIIYGWFVDYHMLIPVLFGRIFKKPIVVCNGGFDCFNVPEYHHGVFYSWWRRPIAHYIMNRVTLLMPVTDGLVYSKNRYTLWPKEKEFGLKSILPELKTPIKVLPTGYNPDQWSMGPQNRENQVCTVAYINSERTFTLKGIDLLLETAKILPDVTFRIVGVDTRYRDIIIRTCNPSSNVILSEPVDRKDLNAIYGQSSVYIQLSRIEGLPNVLCEAMLCGCIPVGSNVFGIPDAIGDAGYIIREPNPKLIAQEIRNALQMNMESRLKARNRIANKYSKEKRKEALERVINDLAG